MNPKVIPPVPQEDHGIDEERIIVTCLASGQPRAYADTEHHYRVTVKSYDFGKEEFGPYWSIKPLYKERGKELFEKEARRIINMIYPLKLDPAWHEGKLQYLRLDYENSSFTFGISEAYTD